MAKNKRHDDPRAVAPPRVVVVAGPNGAGKSTSAGELLQGPLAVAEFVNADAIAAGLRTSSSAHSDIEAGRIMLRRLRTLAHNRADFAFETTLASRSFRSWLEALIGAGYDFHLVFLWLPHPDAAVARVAERVRRGGHAVPEATIRRRYWAGLRNFFDLYRPLATAWQLVDNTHSLPRAVAMGAGRQTQVISDPDIWSAVLQSCKHDLE